MYWFYETVSAFALDSMICSVCHEEQKDTDTIYLAQFGWGEEDVKRAEQIEMIFGKDPFTEFQICENCMEGYCGANPGLDADGWLEKKLEEYENRRGLTLRTG